MDKFHAMIPRAGCRCCRDATKTRLRRIARARLKASLRAATK